MSDFEAEAVTLDRLRIGVALALSDAAARSLEVDTVKDAVLRETVAKITLWFVSRQIFEEEQTLERALTWRERVAALFGRPLPYKVVIQMRHNCPHLDSDPPREHLNFLLGRTS